MFDKILELLAAIAVAVTGIAGINTAATHADPPANENALSAIPAEQANEEAVIRAAIAEHSGQGPSDGLAQAADSLAAAMLKAHEDASEGLEQALEAVTTSPANDAPAGPPAEIPHGPPIELPDGRR